MTESRKNNPGRNGRKRTSKETEEFKKNGGFEEDRDGKKSE